MDRFGKTTLTIVATVVTMSLCSIGCQPTTRFGGDPHVPNGPSGCIAKCNEWRMELVGMVSMGEYSDGCICRIPQRAAKKGSSTEDGSAAGAAAAGAGVFINMLAAEEEQRRQRMTFTTHP
jgi:hypothetical protein